MSDDAESPEGAAADAGSGGADADGDPAGDAEAEPGVESDAEPDASGADADSEAAQERLAEADRDLLAAVAEADESLAADVEARLRELHADREAAEASAEDLESRLKRTAADFQNYKKRAKKRREEERERATESLVERLLDVRDNLKRALEDDNEDLEALREGVKLTLNEFDRVLDAENVAAIEPEPGAEVDPERHEVMMRIDADVEPGTVAEVYQPGYEMAGKVLRPAKVTVADDD